MVTLLIFIYVVAFSNLVIAQVEDDTSNMCGERMEKLKEFYCVSQCIGVSEMVDMQLQTGRLTKAIRTQPMSPTLRCANLDISGPNVKDCCIGPMPDMIFEDKNNAFRTECAKTHGIDEKTGIQYLTEYMLHKWQDQENVFDIYAPSNVPNHKLFCFVECIFSKPAPARWWTDLKIVTNNLRGPWRTATGTKYADLVSAAIDNCNSVVDTMLQITSVTVNNKPCYTAPLMFLQCVRKSLILGCTPNAANIGPGKKCVASQNMKSCDFFQY